MAKDKIHRAVRKALEKDNWTITADPFSFRYKRIQVHADLEAERIFEAESEGRKIAVEIKSFLGASAIDDFENALGQYEFYRYILLLRKLPHRLYIASSADTYKTLLARDGLNDIIAVSRLALIVIDTETEDIIQWIEPIPIAPS